MIEDITDKTIRDRAVAAAGNIADTDQAAVLVVVQGDGQMRVTPLAASVPSAIQALSLANVVLAKAIVATPQSVRGIEAPTDEAAT